MNQPLQGLSKSNKITDKVMVNTTYKTVSECAKKVWSVSVVIIPVGLCPRTPEPVQ